MLRFVFITVMLSGCGGELTQSATSGENSSDTMAFWRWHAEKVDVDLAVAEAINEPGGGDYAKAVEITRASNRPKAIKDYQIGQLIIGGITERSSKPAAGTLEQGLRLIEDSIIQSGQTSEAAPQQLRFLFERGDGVAPNHIPIDPVIAACWHAIETARASDPERCIALRRARLPKVGR